MAILNLASKILNLISDYDSICKARKNNFNAFSRTKNSYFRFQKEYTNEKNLYEQVMTEAFNKHGVACEYYVVTFDTSADPIFGEDSSRRYVRKFDMMGMFELPERTRTWNQFGIEINDIYNVQVSKRHFEKASTYNPSVNNKCSTNFSSWGTSGTYSSVKPLIGDLIKNKYDGLFYEIIQVEDNQDEFLQRSHEWDITVRIFKDNHISTENVTSRNGADLLGVMDNKSDIMDTSSFIETKKLESIFVNPDNTQPHTDPAIYVNNTEKSRNKSLLGDW